MVIGGVNKKTGNVEVSPIYDCGSCLNPMLTDEEIAKLNQVDIKKVINCYSCLKEKGKKLII